MFFFFFLFEKRKTVSLSSKTGESMGLGLIVEGKIGIFFFASPFIFAVDFRCDHTKPAAGLTKGESEPSSKVLIKNIFSCE